MRPTQGWSFEWRAGERWWWEGGVGHDTSEPQSRIIKNLTQFKRTVSRGISQRSKIPPTSVDKIVLETFWLRHRERQPDLPQWGNCSAKEPYRDWSAEPNTQLHLHFSLCGTCAHELENTLLHLLPSGKHFPETLCLFLSSVPPKMPRCTTDPFIFTLESETCCQRPLKTRLYWIYLHTNYISSRPRWPVYAALRSAMPGWDAAKGVSMDATVIAGSHNPGGICTFRVFYLELCVTNRSRRHTETMFQNILVRPIKAF